jgi:endonuclease
VNAVREQVPGRVHGSDEKITVRGILAAPSISTPARVVLEKLGLEFCELNALPEEKKPVPQMALF